MSGNSKIRVEDVIEVLKSVHDPEIPINIYDLGLVYKIEIKDEEIYVELGLTSPFCPLANILPLQVEHALKTKFPNAKISIKLNLEELWSPERMTPEGRAKFKELFGYDPLEKTT